MVASEGQVGGGTAATGGASGSAEPGLVVVGFDGSPSATAALEWAARYAALTGARLRAVSAWGYPNTLGYPIVYGNENFEETARNTLHEAIGRVLVAHPGLAAEELVAEGTAIEVLLQEAKGASLLVVGSRGHGGFVGMLLGSVSAHAVHHAHCPVVVVRSETED